MKNKFASKPNYYFEFDIFVYETKFKLILT